MSDCFWQKNDTTEIHPRHARSSPTVMRKYQNARGTILWRTVVVVFKIDLLTGSRRCTNRFGKLALLRLGMRKKVLTSKNLFWRIENPCDRFSEVRNVVALWEWEVIIELLYGYSGKDLRSQQRARKSCGTTSEK